MRSEKPICAPPRLSEVSPSSPLNQFNVRLIDDGPLPSFQGRSSSASSFHTSLLQAIDDVVSFGLCPQVMFQALCLSRLPRLSNTNKALPFSLILTSKVCILQQNSQIMATYLFHYTQGHLAFASQLKKQNQTNFKLHGFGYALLNKGVEEMNQVLHVFRERLIVLDGKNDIPILRLAIHLMFI